MTHHSTFLHSTPLRTHMRSQGHTDPTAMYISLTHPVLFAYVKEEQRTSPTLECLLDPDMIEAFVGSL